MFDVDKKQFQSIVFHTIWKYYSNIPNGKNLTACDDYEKNDSNDSVNLLNSNTNLKNGYG